MHTGCRYPVRQYFRYPRVNVVSDRAVWVGLSIADGKIEYSVVLHGTDNTLLQHHLEVIRKRIVMTSIVIFGGNVVPRNYVGREIRRRRFLRAKQPLTNVRIAERGAQGKP